MRRINKQHSTNSMETSDLLKRVRQIEIKTRGLSNNIFAGQYHSAFKGKGMSFSEVREYQYGDDVRDIDWNVTARYNKPFVKVFEEERELTVMLLIDVSNSLDFGTVKQLKKDMVTEIAATLAFSAIQNNDKIGVIFFSDRIEKFIPPKKGRKHILYIIRELLDFKPESKRTDIKMAVEYLTNVIKKRCTTFMISDFIDENDFRNALTIANRKHDIVAIQVYLRFQLHIAGKHNEPYQTQTHRKDQGRHRNEKPKDYHRRKHYQMKEQGQKAIHLETTETTLFCFHIL